MDFKNEYEYLGASQEATVGYVGIGEDGMSELVTEEALTHGVEQNYLAATDDSYNTPRTSTTDGVESVANQLEEMTLSPTEYYTYPYMVQAPGTASTATGLGYMPQSNYEPTGQIMQAMPTPALGTPTSPGGQPQYTHTGYGVEYGQNTYFMQPGGEESTGGCEYYTDETRRPYGPNAVSMQPSASKSPPKKHNAKKPTSTASSSYPPRKAAIAFPASGSNTPTFAGAGAGAGFSQGGPSRHDSHYSYQQQGTVFHGNYQQVQQAFGQAAQPTSESHYTGNLDYVGHQGLQPSTVGEGGENLDELAEINYGNSTRMADENAYASHGYTGKGKAVETQHTAGEVANVKKAKRPDDQRFSVFHSKDFWVGRVLKILWAEPKGVNANVATASMFSTKRDDVFSKDRRFLILETWEGHSICVPIMTYGGQGVKKRAHPECHGIVYTGDVPPPLLRGEAELGFSPVQMVPENGLEQLLPSSRVNYRKKYTIEHNYAVNFVGCLRRPEFERLSVQLQNKPARHNLYGGPTD